MGTALVANTVDAVLTTEGGTYFNDHTLVTRQSTLDTFKVEWAFS